MERGMIPVGILLVILSVIGGIAGLQMTGDTAIAALMAAATALLSGVGLLIGAQRLKRIESAQGATVTGWRPDPWVKQRDGAQAPNRLEVRAHRIPR
jgi:hypothetical protein